MDYQKLEALLAEMKSISSEMRRITTMSLATATAWETEVVCAGR